MKDASDVYNLAGRTLVVDSVTQLSDSQADSLTATRRAKSLAAQRKTSQRLDKAEGSLDMTNASLCRIGARRDASSMSLLHVYAFNPRNVYSNDWSSSYYVDSGYVSYNGARLVVGTGMGSSRHMEFQMPENDLSFHGTWALCIYKADVEDEAYTPIPLLPVPIGSSNSSTMQWRGLNGNVLSPSSVLVIGSFVYDEAGIYNLMVEQSATDAVSFLQSRFMQIINDARLEGNEDISSWAYAMGVGQVFTRIAAMEMFVDRLFANDIQIQSSSLGYGVIRSKDYVDGQSTKGFIIRGDGYAKFVKLIASGHFEADAMVTEEGYEAIDSSNLTTPSGEYRNGVTNLSFWNEAYCFDLSKFSFRQAVASEFNPLHKDCFATDGTLCLFVSDGDEDCSFFYISKDRGVSWSPKAIATLPCDSNWRISNLRACLYHDGWFYIYGLQKEISGEERGGVYLARTQNLDSWSRIPFVGQYFANSRADIGYMNMVFFKGRLYMGVIEGARSRNSEGSNYIFYYEPGSSTGQNMEVPTSYGAGMLAASDSKMIVVEASFGTNIADTTTKQYAVFDGESWTEYDSPVGRSFLRTIPYFENGEFFLVEDFFRTAYRSTDAITWTSVSYTGPQPVCSNGIWYARGRSDARIMKSVDNMQSWNVVEGDTTQRLFGFCGNAIVTWGSEHKIGLLSFGFDDISAFFSTLQGKVLVHYNDDDNTVVGSDRFIEPLSYRHRMDPQTKVVLEDGSQRIVREMMCSSSDLFIEYEDPSGSTIPVSYNYRNPLVYKLRILNLKIASTIQTMMATSISAMKALEFDSSGKPVRGAIIGVSADSNYRFLEVNAVNINAEKARFADLPLESDLDTLEEGDVYRTSDGTLKVK